jgi:hypothetical protein
MAFWLLPNTVGNATTASGPRSGGGATATGYRDQDLISGPRSTIWRSTATAGAFNAPAYTTDSDVIATHVVIARADWLLTQAGIYLTAAQRNSGGTWSAISGFSYTPFTSASLMGPKLQDFCTTISPTVYRGIGLDFDSLGAEAMQISKMYFSTGFSFDGDLDLSAPPSWQPLPVTQSVNLFIPQLGFDPYEVEANLTLNWLNNSKASIAAFKALPQILNWPIFLYDDSGDVWNWKLEHVLVETWEEIATSKDFSDISITFKRLKHYE